MSARFFVVVLLVSFGGARAARAQFCPCYSSSSATNPNNCGVADAPGTNPSLAQWNQLIDTACAGPGATSWGDGPTVATIHDGCAAAAVSIPAIFPCELVEAIAMTETNWVQFCAPTTPADQVGPTTRTIVSEDCGYGILQVTDDMHTGETAPWDRDRVAGDARYALQVGLKILGTKWSTTPCVGGNHPRVVEDWYYSTWAYNGLSFSNNPNNPNLDAMRPPCDPNVDCSGYTYQETVWGWMEHPPPDGRWASITPAYPDPADIPSTSGTALMDLPVPTCASPTSCAQSRPTHTSRCAGISNDGGTLADLAMPAEVDGGMIAAPDLLSTTSTTHSRGCGCSVGGRTRYPQGALALLALAAFALLRYRARQRA